MMRVGGMNAGSFHGPTLKSPPPGITETSSITVYHIDLAYLDHLRSLRYSPTSALVRSNTPIMAPKGKGENSKKAAGNAKKAEVAAQKQATQNAKQEAAESQKWQDGAKDNSKAYV